MATTATEILPLQSRFADELSELAVPWHGVDAPDAALVALNEGLAAGLGADPAVLRSPAGVALLCGSGIPASAHPVAQAYCGHQFGVWAGRLGDGRALLLGEVTGTDGVLRDVQLKGSGPTPFARGGDGWAALGPMLREYLVSEAMNALGVPTTRSLAVVTTGRHVHREGRLQGAVLTRVAASHIRVGTFQYAAALGDPGVLRRLADHVIARHHPAAAEGDEPYLALLEAVAHAQADLIARWMEIGFVHGVMNTDNMTISGETIDYGPCAFMERYDPATVFSSIDERGRYAFGMQPRVAQWNLARLAETLLPLIDADAERAAARATTVIEAFATRFDDSWRRGMRAKLGLEVADAHEPADALVRDLLELMQGAQADYTSTLRALSTSVRGDGAPARRCFTDPAAFDAWAARWHALLATEGRESTAVAAGMDARNPLYVPRNELVEEALAAADDGDIEPFSALLEVVTRPFGERPGMERYAEPSAPGARYVTYCGT